MKKIIIGVMGGSSVDDNDLRGAYELGRLIAKEGWVLLNGGRSCGVMEFSAKGAKDAGGLTIGILPDNTRAGISRYIDIPILTGIGDARNYINILSSDIVIACKGAAGTISEIALALKNMRPVILLDFDIGTLLSTYRKNKLLFEVKTPAEAIQLTKALLKLH
ncbi:MAG: TIGR00725 family protein [bacterium]